MKYESVIGLEIHAELNTKTKMFCDSLNDPDEKHPNLNICPVCMGHPGTLPVINQEAVKKVIQVGLALNGEIPEFSQFDRKNYFYPDLPKGYQISQYKHPLVKGGFLDISGSGWSETGDKFPISNFQFPKNFQNSNDQNMNKRIRITRIHLEEDAGRLVHGTNLADQRGFTPLDSKTSNGAGADSRGNGPPLSVLSRQLSESLVDFNRAGRPLMELVTEPDLRSGEEVRIFGEKLQQILRYVGVSNADMEKGELRVEVNVSLRPNDKQIQLRPNDKQIQLRPNDKQIQTNDDRIVLKEESYRLMGWLFEVQNKLGSVYKEKNYQDAIEEVLKREKISYEREKRVKVKLDGKEISEFIIDFLIDNQILLEVKATKFITQEDIRQTLRYLKETGVLLGIIVNFRTSKLEYKRLINPQFDKHSFGFDKNSGESPLGTKVEVKNINSFKYAEDAVNYEIKRQTEILESGGKIMQETRGWNERKNESFSQRSKEESHDYRYFPEPDLPPLHISREFVEELKASLPELPEAKKLRFVDEYGIDEKIAEIIVREKALANYFESVVSEVKEWESSTPETVKVRPSAEGRTLTLARLASNFLTGDFLRLLNETSSSVSDTLVTPENFGEFLTYLAEDKISSAGAKIVFEEMFRTGRDPSEIIREKNLEQVNDSQELEAIVKKVVAANSKPVEDYKKGQENALQFLVGQVMKETKGRANPQMVHGLIKKFIEVPSIMTKEVGLP